MSGNVSKSLTAAVAIAAAATLATTSAYAQSTFNSANADATATVDNNWNTAVNWDTAAVPNGSSARAVVPQGVVAFNLRLQTFAITANQITFQNAGATPLGVTLNNGTGGTLTLAVDTTNPGAPVAPLIVNALGDSTQTADNVISAPVTLGGTLTVQQDHTFAQLNLNGAINDAGSNFGIVKIGAGVLQLGSTTVTNTYTGDTVVNAGVIRIQSPGSLPGGVLAGATTGSNLVINGGVVGVTGQAPLFSRDLGTAPGQVRFTASGGFAGYGGARTVNLGGASAPLVWNSTPNFLTTGQNLILGSTAANNSVELQNPIDFNGAARTINTPNGTGTTGDGKISGALSNGALTKSGNGNLDLIGTTPNTYAGVTLVNAGNLRLGKAPGVNAIAGDVTIGNNSGGNDVLTLQADNQINDTSVLTFKGAVGGTTVGIFRLNEHAETVGGISSAVNEGIIEGNTTSPATITVANGADFSFGGLIRNGATSTGPLSIVKDGAATLTLGGTNPNSYTGSTTVRAGTLKIGAGSSLGTGSVVNVIGGTLDVSAIATGLGVRSGQTLSGAGRVVGAATVQSGGILSPGDPTAANTIGKLRVGDVTLAGGSKLAIDFADGTKAPGVGFDAIAFDGALTVTADAVSPVTVQLLSHDATGAAGVPAGFDPNAAGSWVIASSSSAALSSLATGSVIGSQFAVDTSQWLGGGDPSAWSVSTAGNALTLNYSPVPEPAAVGAMLFAAALGGRRRRKR